MTRTNPAGGDRRDNPGERWDFVHLIQAVVPATDRLEAIAKGAVAFRDFTDSVDTTGIDDYLLVYDFDGDLSTYLTNRWGPIPAAARLTSKTGQRLFTRANARTDELEDHSTGSSPFLISHVGDPYSENRSQSEPNSTAARDDRWLIPAIGLHRLDSQGHLERLETEITTLLDCWECRCETTHRFIGRGTASTSGNDQPIWECDLCEMTAYGPELE